MGSSRARSTVVFARAQASAPAWSAEYSSSVMALDAALANGGRRLESQIEIRLAEASGEKSKDKLARDIFSERFLIRRPLAHALEAAPGQAPVLLIDELDRTDEPFEAYLLEVLSDYQVSIPELGTIKADKPPIVIITSNRTREIHDAVKRRCLYHWVDYPDAARELGISHGLASHHLHQLAKYGFVEQVGGADNRERPWRLVATSFSHEGLDEKPGGAAALAVYEQVAAERTLESFLDWQDRRARWSAGWREHSGLGRRTIYLTEDELAGLVSAFERLIADYTDRRPLDDLSSRPPGSVPVEFSLFVVPSEPTSGGN